MPGLSAKKNYNTVEAQVLSVLLKNSFGEYPLFRTSVIDSGPRFPCLVLPVCCKVMYSEDSRCFDLLAV